jgi:mRNA interferase MazF
MIRGEIWTQAGGPGYAGKPRPVVIVQSDLIADTESVIICGLTTHQNPTIRSRPPSIPMPATVCTNDRRS